MIPLPQEIDLVDERKQCIVNLNPIPSLQRRINPRKLPFPVSMLEKGKGRAMGMRSYFINATCSPPTIAGMDSPPIL